MSDTEQATPTPATSSAAPAADESRWERDLLNRLAFASLAEQRRARRWNLAFKFSLLAYLLLLLVIYLPGDLFEAETDQPHTALVEVRGVISEGSDASADVIVSGLKAAFEDENTKGVILRINSPGGSPVQAAYINDEVLRLRDEFPGTPLYAVIADIGASGGYYAAASADKIFANQSSIVGSIGVLMNGFGFVDAMEKIGVERRLLTAGDRKGFLDPFSPTKPEEVEHVENMLGEIHQQFIDAVRRGRGDRLSSDESVFSGLVWTGERSVSLGLVDELGSSDYVAREVIGAERIVDFTPGRSYLEQLLRRFSASLAENLISQLGVSGTRLQ
ncbi:MAG: S49 family peptidase [Gammaproteobacteria bacterium]|nr:S49 family peptidase [Gammaproteobacteria bacterium]NIM71810.1 S49 family peptidase [Gammaproteobacteria bacterium]NIN37932.1 S49 family peptidase [Gammaproteobacteria bacterium]NIO23566.1 S49 family peptidase [Gammaproteobacteria bacterium]NIO64182.1 S49 family peptidase [Gammaproteobacteria bacterium]